MKCYDVKSRLLAYLICCVFFFSCRKNDVIRQEASLNQTQSSGATLQLKRSEALIKLKAAKQSLRKTDDYYTAVPENECSVTRFDAVVNKYFSDFGSFEAGMYPEYATVNQLHCIFDKSTQYFGEKGEYTKLVAKQQRKLEVFWNMPNQVRINGEHNETMNDRNKIAQVYITYSQAPKEAAYELADQLLAINAESTVFIETPLISFDAFSTPAKLIVVGDGLIRTLTEAGIEGEIAVEGVISHEWGHQVQFAHSKQWYGFAPENRPQTPEFTRQMELEADFLSAYFLTHKHGGTYNWKRVAQFSQLFFNIGDCNTSNVSHHGTPKQRLAAAALGYAIASQTMPRGHLLSADKLHAIFMQNLKRLI